MPLVTDCEARLGIVETGSMKSMSSEESEEKNIKGRLISTRLFSLHQENDQEQFTMAAQITFSSKQHTYKVNTDSWSYSNCDKWVPSCVIV